LPGGGESINCTQAVAYISAHVCNEEWLNETAEHVDPVAIQFAVFGNGACNNSIHNIGISDDCIHHYMSWWGLLADDQHLVRHKALIRGSLKNSHKHCHHLTEFLDLSDEEGDDDTFWSFLLY
jgi:hypothetical protein